VDGMQEKSGKEYKCGYHAYSYRAKRLENKSIIGHYDKE